MRHLVSIESGIIIDSNDKLSANKITKYMGLSIDKNDNVGKKVRFISPTCEAEQEIYEIVGHQMAWGYEDGNKTGEYKMRPAYRVVSDNNNFGRPAHQYELEFIV